MSAEEAKASSSGSSQALVIERITVKADRLVCEVSVAPQAPRLTTPQLAARIQEAFPDLARHACVNDEGDTFGAVLDHTSLPHVLEHLVIDLQAHAHLPGNQPASLPNNQPASLPNNQPVSPSASQPRAHPHLQPQASASPHPSESAAPPHIFVGTTTWVDQFAGRARVEVNFTDDLVALRAFRDATHFLNSIVVI